MTTVAVEETTYHRLRALKDEWGARSFDEVIRRLVDQAKPVPKSMFGVDPDLPRLARRVRAGMVGENRNYRGHAR